MIFPTVESRRLMNQRGYEYTVWASICSMMGVKRYVELGAGSGETCNYMKRCGVERIVAIDDHKEKPPYLEDGIHSISGNSHDRRVSQAAIAFLGGLPDAVFIDADHSYDGVSDDFNLWYPLATTLVGFHDICLFGQGVPILWKQLSKTRRSIEIVQQDYFSNREFPTETHPDASWAGIGVIFKE